MHIPRIKDLYIKHTEHIPIQGYRPIKLNEETITSKETRTMIKNSSMNKCSEPDGFIDNFDHTSRKLLLLILKLFQNTKEKGTLPITFYDINNIMIPRADRHITKKEYYRPLMNIDTILLSKILTNKI